jgi:hypothetical protein
VKILWLGTIGVAAALLTLGGCAGGNASPSTGTSGTDTSVSTSSTSSTTRGSSDSDESDSTTEPESTTRDSSDSTTSTGETGTGSTGCNDGEVGCACRDEAPRCDGDAECMADVCVGTSFCEDAPDEPNDDAPDESVDLGGFDDTDDPQNGSSTLDGPTDVDWLMFACDDPINTLSVEPTFDIESTSMMRVCMFMDCEMGGNPTFDCPGNTTEIMGPFGFLQGCCATDGSLIDLSGFNCPDTSVDNIINWVRIDMGTANACEPYSFTFTC